MCGVKGVTRAWRHALTVGVLCPTGPGTATKHFRSAVSSTVYGGGVRKGEVGGGGLSTIGECLRR